MSPSQDSPLRSSDEFQLRKRVRRDPEKLAAWKRMVQAYTPCSRGIMRIALFLLLIALPVMAAKKPTNAQLRAQVQQLTMERDDLLQQLAGATIQRNLSRSEADAARKELAQLRTDIKENQQGGDALITDLREAKQAIEKFRAEVKRLQAQNQALQIKAATVPGEGDLVPLSEEIQPAKPLNLDRVTPDIKASSFFSARPRGVVVVNVLISKKGDVLAARIIQELPDNYAECKAAEDACVEAAKDLVFYPATSRDGKIHFQVWQGVGFYLD